MLGCVLSMQGAWAESSTRESVLLPAVAGYTLQPGKMYVVQSTMTITADHGNGLNVAPKGTAQAPILYIPAGVTLTVKGANGSDLTGGGAGIYVPQTAELIITGAGTLVATGGNAANGGNGENGHNGGDKVADHDFQEYHEDLVHSGAGGAGGNGGGGAGAGIGGNGATGGQGGHGGAAVLFKTETEQRSSQKSGAKGADGVAGNPGVPAGNIYIMGTVTVTATPGANGAAGGAGGTQGFSTMHIYDGAFNIAGAGGGGAGGGAGYAAVCGIGAGGRSGGGGAGGGSGAVDWASRAATLGIKPTEHNASGRAESGDKVGAGYIDGETTIGSERPRDNGVVGLGYYSRQGGKNGDKGGAAGTEATTTQHGQLYVGSNATVNGTKGDMPANYAGTKNTNVPSDMQITITFVNNEFTSNGTKADNVTVGTKTITIGEPNPALEKTTYQLSATSKYFAGYYTEDNGLGDRIYKGISTDGTNLDIVAAAARSSKNVTLYAHFSHNQHRVNWDYSYEMKGTSGTAVITDINNDGNTKIKYGKLIFHFRDGSSDYRIMSVGSVAEYRVPASPAYDLSGHLINSGLITLTNGTEDANKTVSLVEKQGSNDADFTMHLTDDQLAQFIGYEFIPLSDANTAATNWIKTTKPDNHVTTFSFVGNSDDNNFPLQWTVTLSNLPIYPQYIFVQPLYEDNGAYKVISQTINTTGIECAMDAPQDPTAFGQGSSRTYSGSYYVWKTDNNSHEYNNKIGLTGFMLNGQRYFLNATDARTPLTHYYSYDNDIVTWTSYNNHTNDRIEMTMDQTAIPVLRLEKNATDATLAPTSPYIVVTTYDGTIAAPNTTYSATRPGYKFMGWADAADATAKNATYDNAINEYKASRTIYAVWQEAIAPVFHPQRIDASTEPSHLDLVVTDNVGVTGLKAFVSATDLGSNAETLDWANATVVDLAGQAGNPSVTVQIPSAAASYTYFYFKATDAAGNDSYASSGQIKTDLKAPTYHIYPEDSVCNFDVKVTVMDNIMIAKVEYKKGNGDWTEVTASSNPIKFEAGATDKMKTYIIPKLTAIEKETCTTDTHTPVELSLRVTDGAGNVTVYENHTHMFYDHVWNESHTALVKNSDGTYTTHTYYTCAHHCGHIWDTDHADLGAVSNYVHDYTKQAGDTDEKKQHREQGLMRAETENFFEAGHSGKIAVEDAEGLPYALANDINSAIAKVVENNSQLILLDNTNIANDATAAIATPAKSANVTIDLNGKGLLVNNAASGKIKGNEHVTILLKDDGNTQYTNASTVTGSPVKYVRTFTTTQQGHWQAIHLPFTPDGWTDGVDMGMITQVIDPNSQTPVLSLVITKYETANAMTPTDGCQVVRVPSDTKSSTLEVSATAQTTVLEATYTERGVSNAKEIVSDNDTYKYLGVLQNYTCSDAGEFVVVTNGGQLARAQAGSHQRPYRWVLYGFGGFFELGQPQINAAFLTVGEDYIEDEEGMTTAVENLQIALGAELYTITGIRVTNNGALPAGLYITSNGDKVLINK